MRIRARSCVCVSQLAHPAALGLSHRAQRVRRGARWSCIRRCAACTHTSPMDRGAQDATATSGSSPVRCTGADLALPAVRARSAAWRVGLVVQLSSVHLNSLDGKNHPGRRWQWRAGGNSRTLFSTRNQGNESEDSERENYILCSWVERDYEYLKTKLAHAQSSLRWFAVHRHSPLARLK
ncbi:hypothetical protein DFH07DRAFT_384616 [Mycena maculata]|uniref:Uncharacterized protein n=1 Tax=Mycena maculata TaxID=230809 RepID=A0AAD7JJU8_9AGAR|nr:hypothetical protein DFH07DRAFT_384616 [Mycena maculata]